MTPARESAISGGVQQTVDALRSFVETLTKTDPNVLLWIKSVLHENERQQTEIEANREALQEMAERYGATVEWDSEGLPSLTMPKATA